MFCKKCGTENDDNAKFCRNCGTTLSQNTSSQINQASNNSSSSGSKKAIIIIITVILCAGLIGGTLAYMHFNNDNNTDTSTLNNTTTTEESNNQSTDNNNNNTTINTAKTENNNNDVAVTDVKANSYNIKILGGEFYTGNKLSDKTYCDVYVGKQFAGTNLKIQIYYSRDGSILNPGNIVPKTVSYDGYVSLRSANSFKYYPDHASITLYDTAGNILDTKEVTMSASKGTQTF